MMKNKDPLQSYRQPLITAIALILGFSVGFLADWVTEDNFELEGTADYALLIGMAVSSISLTWAMLRMLKIDYPKDRAANYYDRTVKGFVLGIISLFLGILICFLSS